MPLQTGTVAGLIKLTPSFQSEIGGFDVTPDPAPELRFSVSRSAPQLLDLQITPAPRYDVQMSKTEAVPDSRRRCWRPTSRSLQ